MSNFDKAMMDEAQQGVLGWLLSSLGEAGQRARDAHAVLEVGGLLLFDDVWACELWRRVEAAITAGKDPDRFKHVKQVEELPVAFVEKVIDNGVTGTLLESVYLPELRAAARVRQLKRAMKEGAKTGDTSQVERLLKEAPVAGVGKSLADLVVRVSNEWEAASEHPGELTGIASGMVDLDRLTWGWQRQNFIVIGARPSQGKTALLIGFVRHAAVENNVPTAFFSLESSGEEIMRRLICQLTGADQSKLRGGEASERDIIKLAPASSRIIKAPLKIVDCPGASIGWIQAESRKLAQEMGIKMVVVDYLQKVKAMVRNEKRTYEVAQVSEGLKALAVELELPIIAAGQLNREPDKAKGRAPVLSDLADCGQIERDADIVGLKHVKIDGDGKADHQLILAKFRDGPTGLVHLSFQPHCARFDNAAKVEPEDVPQGRPYRE